MTCTFPGCDRSVLARAYCSKHYQRWRVHGDPTIVGRRQKALPGTWRERNPEAAREVSARSARRRHRQRRSDAVARYGGQCACCGEDRLVFLAIDHVDGGGNAHRRALSSDGRRMVGSSNFYRWLARNDYPSGFRVLCHNCNFAIGHFGCCPHQEDVAA